MSQTTRPSLGRCRPATLLRTDRSAGRRSRRTDRPGVEPLEGRRLLAAPPALGRIAPAVEVFRAARAPAPTWMDFSPVSPGDAAFAGQPISLGVTVGSQGTHGATPRGTVTFTVDGIPQASVKVSSRPGVGIGFATLTLPSLPVGTHRIGASYSGDSHFAPNAIAMPMPLVIAPAVKLAGLHVTGVAFSPPRGRPANLVITFDGPLDPSSSQNPANYQVSGPFTRRGRGGPNDPVLSATDDPANQAVTLTLGRPLQTNRPAEVTVRGGVSGADGVPLDGRNAGIPGWDYLTDIGPPIEATGARR